MSRPAGSLEMRRRGWGEHPLSWPANVSWALLAILALILVPIRDLPGISWVVPGIWLATNALLTWYILARREVPLETPPGDEPAGSVRGTSLFRDALRRLRRNQMATLSATVVLLMVTLCFGQRLWVWAARSDPTGGSAVDPGTELPSFFATHIDHERMHKAELFSPPSTRHWFGTDSVGRDIFARTLYGGTISFLVALVATIVSLVIGVSWGAVSGYFGGRVDHYMMRIVDVMYGLPFMFLVILILALVNGLQATASKNRPVLQQIATLEDRGRLDEARALEESSEITTQIRTAVWLADVFQKPSTTMFFALGLVSWLTMARITRGQVLTLREREFVVAARTIGAGNLRIIFFHIVPNLLGPVIIYTTLTIPTVMLTESFLSFIGLGISEPECSWGSLAKDGIEQINVIKPYWWILAYPAGAMFVALFSLNFIGDGLRDALDPRMKR